MAAGSGMKDIQALIPIVGLSIKAVNAKEITQSICVEEEPAYRRYETEYAHREREAQRVSLLRKECNSYK